MSVHDPHNSGHTTDKMNEADVKRLANFKDDIRRDAELSDETRSAANEDMRFINVPGGMWENFLQSDDFLGNTSSTSSDRVELELDIVSNFLQRFIGEWNLNRTGVEFKADDSGTTDDDAELINGRYRFDFRKGSGKLSTDNAVDEAATCGFGAMKLATVFENPEDPENDNQIIEWRPKYNAYSTIYWDTSAKRTDKRDASYCTELERFTPDAFERAFPDKQPVSAYQPADLRFFNFGGTTEADIYVATRYEIIKNKVDVFVYNNLQSGKVVVYSKEDHDKIKDELRKDELMVFVRKRKVIKQTVEKTVFSGIEILEPTRRIAGKWIPIIPFYGYRSYVDGVETYRGLIRKLKDAARLFNAQISQLAENAFSGGQEIPIFNTSQMLGDNMKADWADKNNQPYLLVDPSLDKDENVISAGPVGYLKPAALDQSTTTLLGIVPQFIQDITGGPPQEIMSGDMSGKAINALIKRENLNTQVINDNIANAIVWSGMVYASMAAEVYNTERKLNVIGKDGTESVTQLLEDVVDEQTGEVIIANDLDGKKFHAYPDSGPQYETQAEQTVEDLKGMLETMSKMEAGAQYMPVMLAVLLDNISGVGLDPLKDFNRKIMLVQGLVEPANAEEKAIVEAAQQPKEDPQAKLLEAAAEQQTAEAESLRASSQQKVSDAGKKQAETQKILKDIGLGDRKLVADQQADIRKEVFQVN